MNIGECATPDAAVKALLSIRSYKPFKYSGAWFVTAHAGQGFAYRTVADLRKRLEREGALSTPPEVFRVG